MDASAIKPRYVSVGRSVEPDPKRAVEEALATIDPAGSCFVLAFVPAHMDAHCLAAALDEMANGTPVFGCTTAGQISQLGYETDALLLMSFPRKYFRCASLLFSDLGPFNATEVAGAAQQFNQRFRKTAGWHRLGLLFADGLSKQEDLLASTLNAVLENLPIYGGSAGDGLRFERSFVLHGGQAHENAAVLVMLETRLSYQGLGFDHFLPCDRQMVITSVDQDERLVNEINGSPAATEYARLVGCDVADLSPLVFAENPLLLEHGGAHYVRAIGDATPSGDLAFLAAIDDGLVMTMGTGKEIIETLNDGLDTRAKSTTPPDFILGFDCVLRRLEIEQKGLAPAISDILAAHRVFGFNTYGEQQSGLHMNQTFVGVAFFEPEDGGQIDA